MSVLDIHSQDGGIQLEELEFAGVEPRREGPDYEELLAEEAKLAAFDPETLDRSAFEDGVEVGRLTLAHELLERAPGGGFDSQADAARWGRWVVHQLRHLLKAPRL